MFNYAKSLGIDVQLGCEITDYWETECEAGVIVQGERIAADCVVCAEGINSEAITTITGQAFEEKETGFTATRGFLNTALLADDPKVRWLQEQSDSDKVRAWVGDNTQVHIWSKKGNGEEVFWYCLHKVRSLPHVYEVYNVC
jgi:2-polyprenyl-6-methoxyphenol hydroxylase-like FAD-dependent oxidoreductase